MSNSIKKIITSLLIGIGLVGIVIGCINGEPALVMAKGARVCLSCIGVS